jgi:acetyl-CoA carboxylase biotin carboxylase subunit
MRRTLDATIVEGIETSVPIHQQILADPEFVAGNLSTRFMDRFAKKPNQSRAEHGGM